MYRTDLLSLFGFSYGVGLLLIGAPCHAQVLYNVKMDTSQLIGHAAAPFSLDFQLTDGSGVGDANSRVTLSNFQFGGGGAAGSPALTGGAAGTLAGTVMLTDNAFFSEFIQGFTPGSFLSFQVQLTGNVDAGPVPDEFSFAILDKTSAELPTQGLGDAFLIQDINSLTPTAQTYASDSTRMPFGGGVSLSMKAPVISPVPEQATSLSFALLVLGLLVQRITSRQRTNEY